MKARRFFAFVAAAGMLFAGGGCTPNEEGDGATADPLTYELNPTSMVALSSEETVETVQLTTNGKWNVTIPEDHSDIVVTPLSGKGNATLTVTVPAHEDRIVALTVNFSKKTTVPGFSTTIEENENLTFNISQNASGTEKVATNVKAVRDLLLAMNPTSTKTNVTAEVAAMTLTGVVVGVPNGNMGNDYLFAIQDDGTEAGCGLTIYHDKASQLEKGNVVTLSLADAQVSLYGGLLQLSASNSVELATANRTVDVEPIEVAYADILSYESQYIKVTDKVTPSATAIGKAWNSGTSGVNVKFTTTDNKTLIVRVNKDASFKNDIVPNASGILCGVASRYNSDVQLLPQYSSDIQLDEQIVAPEVPVVTIAEIAEAGTYKVENAWVVAYTGNGPILTDASGAFINVYINGNTHKTIGEKMTVEGAVNVRQGGFQFNSPTVTVLDGQAEVVYPTPATYEGAALEAFCDKFAVAGAAYHCEYVELKGVLTKADTGHYGIAFSGVDASKYDGSLSKTPATELNLDDIIGSSVVLRGFVTDYNLPYLSITTTSVAVDENAKVLAADAITNVPKDGVTNATHDITVIGIDAVTTEVDGTVVTAASVAGNVLTYTVSANEGEKREGWIKLSAEGVEDVTIAVKQSSAFAYNFISDAAFVDSSNNYSGRAKINGSATENASGFKIGTGSLAGYFESQAVGVEGDVTFEFYAVAWKGKSATLYVRKKGSNDLLGQFVLKANEGATSGAPYTMTLTDDDYYSVNVAGVTADTVFEFSTDVSFTKVENSSSGRAIVVGVHLVGGTPSTPTTPETPEQPEGGETPSTPAEGKFVEVTAAPADWSGKYLIVFGNNAHGAVSGKDLISTSVVTISNGEIVATSELLNNAAVTVAALDSNYSILLPSGSYLSNAKNSCATSASAYAWTFDYTESGVKMYNSVPIENVTYILYNNSNNYFRCYVDKNGQAGYTLPKLYKYVAE